MKKIVATLLYIGFMSWIPIGSSSQSSGDEHHNHDRSNAYIISGGVKEDHHGNWDVATFGLVGSDSYKVFYVDLLDATENVVHRVEFEFKKRHDGISWYQVSLEDEHIVTLEDFNLGIHFGKRRGEAPGSIGQFSFNNTNSRVASLASVAKPNDPEESVVIVRYP